MKTQKILIPFLGMLALISGSMTTQAVVDPLYYQNIQTVEVPEDTTIGASVTSTTPTAFAVDPVTITATAPSPTPTPSPAPSPAPRPSAPEAQVLGVSTEKDHSKEYYEDLKAQILSVKAAQQNFSQEQQKINYLIANPENQLPLLLISLTLAVIALMTEWRYQRMLQLNAAMQRKVSAKSRNRK